MSIEPYGEQRERQPAEGAPGGAVAGRGHSAACCVGLARPRRTIFFFFVINGHMYRLSLSSDSGGLRLRDSNSLSICWPRVAESAVSAHTSMIEKG